MQTDWRNQYDDEENDTHSSLFVVDCSEDVDRTQQDGAEDADINVIVQRFGLTGKMPEAREGAMWGDFTEVADYQTSLNALIAAEEAFMSLPAKVRDRFQNNPAELLEFVQNDQNRPEAIELGLLPKPAPEPILEPKD